ncbi:MAG TPA: hypothetical protein VMK65_00260 [Longimicrobiales bacterium]|nr:hypothetical protein [Longimicrobiales bacterium]
MSDEKRRQRREIQLQNSESVWLQKALFALRKAEDVHEKLADVRAKDPAPYTLEVDGSQVELEAVEEAIERRAQGLIERVRERRRAMR